MNRLQEGRAVEGVFRDVNAENLYVTTATIPTTRRLRVLALKKSRRRCILISTTIFLVVVAAVVLTVHTAQELSSSDGEQSRDPFFYDPESRIFNLPRIDHRNYQRRTPQCPDWTTTLTAPSTTTTTPEWDPQGQEMLKTIKEELRSNTAGGVWANHFGFGTNVLISGDGQKLAVSYEGYAGFDKAFGVHVDVRVWNGTHWDLEQTVTAVRRHHGRDPTNVRYLSMALSKDGNRLAFSDGHGVHVYAYHEQPETGNKKDRNKKWLPVGDSPLEDGARLRGGRQFGTHLSFNCDGSVLAVAGTTPRSSFLRVYQEEISQPQVDDTVPPTVHHRYAETSQIEGKNHGGGIALNGVGDRIAMGSTASEGWRGIVQVFDRNSTDHWNRVGQAVVGETTMELFGGQVALSADGSTLVAASNEGGNNRVATYRLMEATAEAAGEPGVLMWQQLGQSLHGDINEHEHFGADIDINHDGTILAIGAPGDYELFQKKKEDGELPENDAPFVNGRIYMYQLSTGGDEWTPIDNGELVGGSEGDLYGKSVALSASGSTVVGGAPERVGKAFEHILGGALVYQSVV